jgi:hypothetical protein
VAATSREFTEENRLNELADRLACSRDPEEQDRTKEELARLTFGE